MEEAQTQDSVTEVVSPAADVQQESQQPVSEQAQAPAEDSNWIKNLRRDRKEALRRAEEAENRAKMQEELLHRMMSQQPQHFQQQAPQEEDVLEDLAKQEYVAGDKVAKALKKQQEQFRKEIDEIKKTHVSQTQNSLINDLRREYSDFDQVVNSETLAILEETNPRLAQAIASSRDPYHIAVQSYEYIKAKGLANKSLDSRRATETERKIEQNRKTVQSPQAFDKRPIAQAFQMTDNMKKELQSEMYTYARQAGMGY